MSNLAGSVLGRNLIVAAPVVKAPVVPALREDLQLFPAAANRDGSPAWMIQDPVTNRFFRLGWLEFELLARWTLGDPTRILQSLRADTGLRATTEDLERLVRFLRQHMLLRAADDKGVDHLRAAARKPARWKWLLHNYLFIRIPLWRPQRLLQAVTPALSIVYSRGFFIASLCAALLGLLLVARQWDSFVHTFHDFLSPAGLLGYAVALIFAKTLHEFGHAVTATRLGVRVAHMGVAFLVLWPMLYTDTGESWKLTDRRQRLAIAAAGMATEFALAGFATLAWSLVDDGALRSALFFLATTSWVLTLAINASPFMRFDGYFLLSDALDMQNLHERSFAQARTWLRRRLLGWDEPWPESFEPPMRRFLIGFALTTWLYRLVVFVGIALAVYHYFFKLLGIFLFAVEVAWFIARPLWSELKVWAGGWSQVPGGRRLLLGAVGLAVLGALAFPWARSVEGEGWIHATQQQLIYSPFPARVASLHAAGPVAAGTPLVVLDSPDTRSRAAQSRILADALALQLDQTIGRADGHEQRAVLAEQLARQLAELGAQQAELQRLELSAPFGGQLLDLDPDVREGVWITANQPIGILIDPSNWVVDALIEQKGLQRVHVGSIARFYRRHQAGPPLRGEVIAIDSARAQVLPHAMLATEHGGRVAASRQTGSGGAWAPRDTLYRVRVRVDPGQINVGQSAAGQSGAGATSTGAGARDSDRGTVAPVAGGAAGAAQGGAATWAPVGLGSVVIAGDRRSLLSDLWTSVAAVAIRESGF